MTNYKYIVKPSVLEGEILIDGAKNSALKLLAATLLTQKNCIISNYPSDLIDIKIHEGMISKIGKKVTSLEKNIVQISGELNTNELNWEDHSIRNSLLILGCLLAKTGYGKVPLPGGCKIGERKYDIHLDLMKNMGAEVWEDEGYLFAKIIKGNKLKAIDFTLPLRSTGATENGILMGVLANGVTRIWNPHIRPEIVDLIEMLIKMGAKIKVNGQESIIIEGVDALTQDVTHKVIPDNMEAITYLIAGAIAGKTLEIKNFPFNHLEIPLIHLRESGLKIYRGNNSVIVKKSNPYPIDIATGPYPGINSDMQPLFAIYGLMSKGVSTITDLRFQGRFNYSEQLKKMNGTFDINGNMLKVIGGNPLKGNIVDATDLRAGAALIIAGLIAEGETTITNAWQIERGYNSVINKLTSIKANIIKN